MSCQTTYSPPITIPTGLTGAAGAAGASGGNGASMPVNETTAVTSTGTGSQNLINGSYDPGSVNVSGDIYEFEAYLAFTTAFVGSVSIRVETTDILTYSVTAEDIHTPPPGETDPVIILKSEVTLKSVSSQNYISSIKFVEDSVTEITLPQTDFAEDMTQAFDYYLKCNPTAGAITCKKFTITKKEKV